MAQGQPQELVLTLAGAYLRPRDRQIWSGGLVALLGEFGYSPGASRVALSRLTARDMLIRTRDGRLSYYSVTPRCADILAVGDARIFTLGRRAVDGAGWTVLWHTLPEDRRYERGRLTRRLRFHGFGPMQDGTWIAAGDRANEIRPVLDDLRLHDETTVLVGRLAPTSDPAGFVRRAWDLTELAGHYRSFVDTYRPFAPTGERHLDDRRAFVVRTRLVHAFRQFPFADPELPPAVADPPEHRAAAIDLFHDIYAALAPPAQRYFNQVTTP